MIFHCMDGYMLGLRRRKFLWPLVALCGLFADTSKVGSAYWNGVQLKAPYSWQQKKMRESLFSRLHFLLLFRRFPVRISVGIQVSWYLLYFFFFTSGMCLDSIICHDRFLQSLLYSIIQRNVITRRYVAWFTDGFFKYITNRKWMSMWLPVIG